MSCAGACAAAAAAGQHTRGPEPHSAYGARAAAAAARNRPEPTLCVWDALEPHYKRWKEGQEKQTDGYALEGWAGGISAAQIQACKAIHIYSVEDLSLATDEAIQKLGMGALKLRETARAFVASLNGEGAKLAKENAEMKVEIERLTKEADDDRKAMREFMAKHQMQTPDMPADAAGELATAKPAKVKKAA